MTMDTSKENSRAITFKNQEHEMFYRNFLPKCKRQDVYHKALMYCLGISGDTRRNIESPLIIKADLRERMLPHGKENFEKK